MEFREIQKDVHKTADDSGWHDEPKNSDLECFCNIHAEISEATEEIRKGNPPTLIYYREDGKPEGVGIELADSVIRTMDYCEENGIDLYECIRIKNIFNKTRPYKHGKVK